MRRESPRSPGRTGVHEGRAITTRRIEILFLEGCPNVELAIGRARDAIRSTGLNADVHLVQVRGEEDAVARRFLGSPTVRVDGGDVEGSAIDRADFGLQCRVYPSVCGMEGAPPVAWIESALLGTVVERVTTTADHARSANEKAQS